MNTIPERGKPPYEVHTGAPVELGNDQITHIGTWAEALVTLYDLTDGGEMYLTAYIVDSIGTRVLDASEVSQL